MQCALWFLDLLLSLQQPKAKLQRNCSGLIGNVLYCCFSEQYPDQQELSRLKANSSLSPGKPHADAEKIRTHRSSALSNIYCFSCSEAELQITDTSPIFKWSFYNYIAMPYWKHYWVSHSNLQWLREPCSYHKITKRASFIFNRRAGTWLAEPPLPLAIQQLYDILSLEKWSFMAKVVVHSVYSKAGLLL